jgi:DME family drug/metabolite transporter
MKKFSWQVYALLAAVTEASTGVFNKNSMEEGFASEPTAFYACLISFLILTFFILLRYQKAGMMELFNLKNESLRIAIAAVFGLFMVFYFETKAYFQLHVASVVFIMLGTSTITTLVAGRLLLKEQLTFKYLVAICFAIAGLFLIFHHYGFDNLSFSMLFSVASGLGYGVFLVYSKKSNLEEAGFKFLWWFLGFGALYLSIPFFANGASLPSVDDLKNLFLLAIIPTLGGYYFTIRALTDGKASEVQIVLLSMPLFAALFGFLAFQEILTGTQLLGAAIILIAIGIVQWPTRAKLS